MTSGWKISDAVIRIAEKAISDFSPHPSFAYYPSIMWSLGGVATKPGAPDIELPPEYTLGLIKRTDLQSYKIVISNKKFGFVAFLPSDADARSSRRLIDFDGKNIVVR